MKAAVAIAAVATVFMAGTAAADTMSAKAIAAGVSDQKTEMAQEAWWDEHMANKVHEITGRVTDVQEGTFSGYWVQMDIGRGIGVQCGLPSEMKPVAAGLRKGAKFTCNGEVANTWSAVFGVSFIMDMQATGAESASNTD